MNRATKPNEMIKDAEQNTNTQGKHNKIINETHLN